MSRAIRRRSSSDASLCDAMLTKYECDRPICLCVFFWQLNINNKNIRGDFQGRSGGGRDF